MVLYTKSEWVFLYSCGYSGIMKLAKYVFPRIESAHKNSNTS